MSFKNLSPGDSAQPVFSARRHNAINALLERSGIPQPDLSQNNVDPWRNLTPLVKNTTAVDVPLGGVLGLSGIPYAADENTSAFKTGDPIFLGELPNADTHGTRIAIALDLCPIGKYRKFGASGWCRARVDITDTDQSFAAIVDDDATKLESADEGFPMVAAETGSGEKWAWVFLGGGPGGGMIRYYVAAIPYNDSTPQISAATFLDYDAGPPEVLPRRVYGTGTVYKYVDTAVSTTQELATTTTTVKSNWDKSFNASAAGKALVGHFWNDWLMEVNCEEIDIPDPWPPTP